MPTQLASSTREPDIVPTLTNFAFNGVELQYWIHKDFDRGLVQIMVKKKSDPRPFNECERYPIFTITANGECYRNSGLPSGWGIKLTKERRIKEIQ